MTTRTRGFTLLELMIVVAVIGIVAAVAVPNMVASRVAANEQTTVSILKAIAAAQQQCQASGYIDVNGNGIGEYGYFAELTGRIAVRDSENGTIGTTVIEPPVLMKSLGEVRNEFTAHSGYHFMMCLPSDPNLWTKENPNGGADGIEINATHAETYWACYAWPVAKGSSGTRAFYINQTGLILSTNNALQGYSGVNRAPEGYAAVLGTVPSPGTMAAPLAVGAVALDGGVWTPADG